MNQDKPNQAAEVYGYWICKGRSKHRVFCSNCAGVESSPRPYCPRCGTKMDWHPRFGDACGKNSGKSE